MWAFHVYTFLILVSIYNASATVPSFLKTCKISEPGLNSCIEQSIEQLKPRLKTGIKELNIPSFEPLELPELIIKNGEESVHLNVNLTSLKVWGALQYNYIKMRADIPKNRFSLQLRIPHLYAEGDYDMDMKLLLLEYEGVGKVTANFTNAELLIAVSGERITINDVEYLEIKKARVNLIVKGPAYFYFDNMFKGDPVLAQAAKAVVNDNSDAFLNELRPGLEKCLATTFMHIVNKLLFGFPYKELFPR